jgi:transposase InsO family protein
MIVDIRQITGYRIRPICAALGVSRSSYYHAAEPTPRQRADQQIGETIQIIFRRHRRRYGSRRIWEELDDGNIVCSAYRVRRIMSERGLRAIQAKTYVPRTSDGRADKPSPNLLIDEPLPSRPNEVWAGDITFIPTSAGWIYLAVVIDLCSRKIVGWALAENLRTPLVVDALKQALGSRRTSEKTIFHSDRGSQYGSTAYRQLLTQAGMRQSMSARANPYHNAWTESFIGTLKAEMLDGGCFVNAQDAKTELFAYIESYYNTHRKHSALGYKTPVQFEDQILN